MNKSFPVGAAQATVLAALGLTAKDWNEAEAIFESIGIAVSSKRVGRTSQPVVRRLDTVGGGWTPGGDGETYAMNFKAIDLTPLAQWMAN